MRVRHSGSALLMSSSGSELIASVDMSHDPDPTAAASFPASLGTAVGDVVRAVPSGAQQPRTAWWLRRFSFSDTYDLLAVGGRAGAISGISGGTPRMASAEGTWSLEKRRRLGWEYVLVDSDGQHGGW